MDISALRQYLKELPSAHYKIYDTHKEYRADMLAKWNVHNEQVCRMLKKAVSFKPIVNIEEFITENICDVGDGLDTVEMQQNIQDYKRHEQLARRQEEKLVDLKEIARYFRELQVSIDRLQQQKFLVLWAEKEELNTKITKSELEKKTCIEEMARAEARITSIAQTIATQTDRKEKLIAARATDDVYQEKDRLEGQKRLLEQELGQIDNQLQEMVRELRLEAQRLCAVCKKIGEFPSLPETGNLQAVAIELATYYAPFVNCTPTLFGNATGPVEEAQLVTSRFKRELLDATYCLERKDFQMQEDFDENESKLAKLKKDIKDYNPNLLRLKGELERRLSQELKRPVQIEILADVLEIAPNEDQWRGAVEAYLHTQKFYLLVEPTFYAKALTIFDAIKRDYGKNSFGLVDIGKLREKENLNPWPDSLASKVVTDNPLARDYIDYLLGRMVCCTHVQQLRRHKTAITADGMLYQGYVSRPLTRERMENAFIGRQAVALRMAKLQEIKAELTEALKRIRPITRELQSHSNREYLISSRFVSGEWERQREHFLRSISIKEEVCSVETQLSQLNLYWIMELNGKIEALKEEILGLDREKEQWLTTKEKHKNRIYTLEYDLLPEQYQGLAMREDQLEENFASNFQDTVGIPRYEQELARLGTASKVAQNFGGRLSQTQQEQISAQQSLREARGAYVSKFQPCSFRVDNMVNDEFAEEQKLLEESELPRYREKIQKARESALEQFQNDFLAKLKSSIDQVRAQVSNLNKALKQAQFGADQYQFKVERNPDYAAYYDMIMADELMEGEGGIFALAFQQKYGPLIEELFRHIASSDDTQLNLRKQSELQQNIERYTDYRTYLKFDLETTDQNGNKQMLSQTLETKSGGETQTPFYIAVLASFAQLYQVHHNTSAINNTVRLVLFDEAFNKMDSDRIIESIRLLRKMGLQAIICTPPDKLPDIMPEADCTFLVSKEKYRMHILPFEKEMA